MIVHQDRDSNNESSCSIETNSSSIYYTSASLSYYSTHCVFHAANGNEECDNCDPASMSCEQCELLLLQVLFNIMTQALQEMGHTIRALTSLENSTVELPLIIWDQEVYN